ncbi:MAG: DsbE family thiol:disulfide interchange protein [Alphaproteobacteria bacterium]|nr:DsbE family thiol:disulfide interchange protein [Alphaproteobacteria bacterium]
MKREKWIAASPLIIFGVLALVLIIGLHHRGSQAPEFALHVGDAAPVTDLPVLGHPNMRFTTASWRGRPYVVNFFASWCADCRAEHEELMTLQAGHVPIIGITYKDHADNTTIYLDREGNPFVAVAEDESGRTATGWGLAGVPETFVIDAGGIVRWHYSGALTDEVASDELMPVWENVSSGTAR